MQKKLLATLVASLIAGQSVALELRNDVANSLEIGGKIGIGAVKSKGKDLEMVDAGPRINFIYTHKYTGGWTGSAVAEWGFYAVDNDNKDQFFNRLGNVGLKHDLYGTFTAGKAWSVTSEVSGWTDSFVISGGKASGIYSGRNGMVSGNIKFNDPEAFHNSGDTDGTARADDVIQYRNSLDLGDDAGSLNVGIQYQLKGTAGKTMVGGQTVDGTRKGGYGVALSYDLPMGFSLGATYNATKYAEELNQVGDMKVSDYKGSDKSTSVTVGARFKSEVLELAAVYGQFKNKTAVVKGQMDKKSTGIELYSKLPLPQVVDGFYLQAGVNRLAAKDVYTGDKSKAKFTDYIVAAVYETGPMQFASQYTMDKKVAADGKKDKDNIFVVQAVYNF